MPMVTRDSGANQTDDAGSLLFVGPAKALWVQYLSLLSPLEMTRRCFCCFLQEIISGGRSFSAGILGADCGANKTTARCRSVRDEPANG